MPVIVRHIVWLPPSHSSPTSRSRLTGRSSPLRHRDVGRAILGSMVGTEPERIIITKRNARVTCVIVLMLFVAASVGGIYDPVDRSP